MPLSPQPRRHAHHAADNHALATGDQRLTKLAIVNPSGVSRTNLNNPEQIRTNLNSVVRRPLHISVPPPSPIHLSPLLGGRLRGGCSG